VVGVGRCLGGILGRGLCFCPAGFATLQFTQPVKLGRGVRSTDPAVVVRLW
jgi:hypothetical protein